MLFSQALSGMTQQAAFEPKPAAEAKRADIEISDEAAISRLRPVQDDLDSGGSTWKTSMGICHIW
jgi:hypothetical protein